MDLVHLRYLAIILMSIYLVIAAYQYETYNKFDVEWKSREDYERFSNLL